MEALIAAGYKEDTILQDEPTLFTFPYDWRAGNNLTANLLKEKINQVKEITGKNKVDIITHSMGGLVARLYIEDSDLSYTELGSAITVHNSANPIIRYNNIHHNQSGVSVSDQAIPLINNNNIFNNINYGVEVNQWYNLTKFVDARANWWGSSNGPIHINNPNGDGDKVSDKVDYSNWLLNKY